MPKTVRQPADGVSTAVIRRVLAAEENAQARIQACRQRAKAARANAHATARRMEARAMQRIQRIQQIAERMQAQEINALRLKEKHQAKKLSTFKPPEETRKTALTKLARHLLGFETDMPAQDREH